MNRQSHDSNRNSNCKDIWVAISFTIYRGHLGLAAQSPKHVSKSYMHQGVGLF